MPGIGKSRSFAEFMKKLIAQGKPARIVVTKRTLEHYKAQFTPEEWEKLTVEIVGP